MKIPLSNFEQYIDETILKRGLAYFKKGQVTDVEEISPGCYKAMVEGSEDYIVELTIKNNVITKYECDCPYDIGPVCKHIAAVIFYLQTDVLNMSEQPPLKRKAKTAKQKTPAELVNEILVAASADELKQFIRDKTLYNVQLRNSLLASFARYNSTESKEMYSRQVQAILQDAAGRNGYIDWSEVRQAASGVNELLQSAEKNMADENFHSAALICMAVMEQMTKAFEYADDSGGEIGSCIDYAFNILEQMAEAQKEGTVRQLLFGYCLEAYEKNIFRDWDWHTDVLSLAANMVQTDAEAEHLIRLAEMATASSYEQEAAQLIIYNVLLKTSSAAEANTYLLQHINNSRLRHKAIAADVVQKKYEAAIQKAFEGIKHDQKDKPGLTKDWYNWLLKIAQAQKNTDKIIEYARWLLIDNFSHEQDYYAILKKEVPAKEWPRFVENMIKDISVSNRWSSTGLTASIYIKEAWWSKLFELVKQSPELHIIEQYESHLAKDYAAEIAGLYAGRLINFMKMNTGRSHYQTACRYIRRIIKLGEKKKAAELVESFRKEYPARRALQEELNMI
jgi:uncharacterized Zn finger protein